MTNSHTEAWERVRRLEDIKGLVALIDASRQAIKRLAWHQGSYQAIYAHAEEQRLEIERLKGLIQPFCERWLKEARDE